MQNNTKWRKIEDKQIRHGNRLRQVCRQGQECRRWNIAHLEMASQEEFEDDGNIDYELEQVVYLRERNEKYVIRWKNMFHARTNNCIYISRRASEIVLFPQQNLQQILSFELFFCINFYYTALTFFLFFWMYIQYWVSWSLPPCRCLGLAATSCHNSVLSNFMH